MPDTGVLSLIGPLLSASVRLGRQGQLVRYFRGLRGNQRLALLNLFLSLPETRDRKRLSRLAWRFAFNRLYNDFEFSGLPWRRFDVEGLAHLEGSLAHKRGALVCTQHLGPYRRIFLEVAALGFSVDLVVTRPTYTFLMWLTAQNSRFSPEERLLLQERIRFLNVEEPGIVGQMLDALEAQRVVLVYLDGNTGVGRPGEEVNSHANTVPVQFFGQTILVRRGVAQIAWSSDSPIVPVFATRVGIGLPTKLRFHEPILPDRAVSRDSFCAAAMQHLFKLSEEEIACRPEQFEEWSRLHRWRSASHGKSVATPVGSAERTHRFCIDHNNALLVRDGDGYILADALRQRLVRPGVLLVAVLQSFDISRSPDEVVHRLQRRFERSEILRAVGELCELGFLIDCDSARLAASSSHAS